jgi:hypothetical protein
VVVLAVDVERHRIALGLGDEQVDTGGEGAAPSGAPARFGTFADLLKKR